MTNQLEMFQNQVHPEISKILNRFKPQIQEEDLPDAFKLYENIEPQKEEVWHKWTYHLSNTIYNFK